MTRIARPRVGQGSPAGMFRCGGRGGGREGLGKFRWVVSEERVREMNFFSGSFRS